MLKKKKILLYPAKILAKAHISVEPCNDDDSLKKDNYQFLVLSFHKILFAIFYYFSNC